MELTTWTEAYEAYDDMLDETNGPVKIGELEYSTSRVLRVVDPIAYRVGLSDWLDSEGIDTDALEGYERA